MPKTIDKKTLKKYVNENGFYYSTEINATNETPEKYKKMIPEGATYIEGIVSNGKLNRNGYKIKPEAFMASVNEFMRNPVVLYQHDPERVIGQALGVELENGNIKVQAYVYDDLTDGRIARNLVKGLSTGHITKGVEFENEETGEVISEEEFKKFSWEEQMSDKWTLVVTELEWVEFSVVSIPSNRDTYITKKNTIEAYIKNGKISADILANSVNADEEKQESGEKKEEQDQPTTESTQPSPETDGTPEPETAGENPDSSEAATETSSPENEATATEENSTTEEKIRISSQDREKLQAMSDLLIKALSATVVDDEKKDEPKATESAQSETPAAPSVETQPSSEAKAETTPPSQGAIQSQPESQPNSLQQNTVNEQLEKVLKSFLAAITEQNKQIAEQKEEINSLKAVLDRIPYKKALVLNGNNPVNNKAPKEEKKGETQRSAFEVLQEMGVSITS